jgi:hypothetical protein
LLSDLLISSLMLEFPEPPLVVHSIVLFPAVNVSPSFRVVNQILRPLGLFCTCALVGNSFFAVGVDVVLGEGVVSELVVEVCVWVGVGVIVEVGTGAMVGSVVGVAAGVDVEVGVGVATGIVVGVEVAMGVGVGGSVGATVETTIPGAGK